MNFDILIKDKNLNVEILTSDVMQKKERGETILRKFEKEEINVIIGTQILAKGHHFPKLTLVVVIFFGLFIATSSISMPP